MAGMQLKAYPRFLSFVAEINNQIVGYIVWAQKSGFRAEAVLELEQRQYHLSFRVRVLAGI